MTACNCVVNLVRPMAVTGKRFDTVHLILIGKLICTKGTFPFWHHCRLNYSGQSISLQVYTLWIGWWMMSPLSVLTSLWLSPFLVKTTWLKTVPEWSVWMNGWRFPLLIEPLTRTISAATVDASCSPVTIIVPASKKSDVFSKQSLYCGRLQVTDVMGDQQLARSGPLISKSAI